MKKRFLTILFSFLIIIGITGCAKNNNEGQKEKPVVNKDCCDGCVCGDTIELLKNIETAWTLTTINNKGEYVYNNNSFINFNGTGKNKFAFYKNDNKGNTISEIKGNFKISKDDEIILTTDSKKEIICKLGYEVDLLAVLECNENFGTFTLQKEGTIDLPGSVIDVLYNTKIIVIKGHQSDYKTKKIKEEKDINTLISVIENSKVWTGSITLPSPMYEIELQDGNNKSIAKIQYNPNHYFEIKINNKSYNLINIDKELLNTIL